MSEAWSRVSLRVSSSEWNVDQLEEFLDIEGSRTRTERVWLVEFLSDDTECQLHQKLLAAQQFIESHVARLRALPSHCLRDLFIGWSPGGPQGSLIFPRRFVSTVSLVDADIIVDVYTE